MTEDTGASTRESTRLAAAAASGGIGAAATAALAGACCLGPLAVSVLGVGGAVAAAGLAPYRPYLLGVSVLLVLAAFGLVYRPARLAGDACRPGRGRVAKRVVWLAAGTIALSFALPFLLELA